MRQYILYNNPSFEVVDEETYIGFMGDSETRSYVTKVYRGLMTLEEVPETYRETVNTTVNNKISKWGTYDSQNIPVRELYELVENIIRDAMLRGAVNELFDALLNLRDNVTDELASTAVKAYPHLRSDNSLVEAGTRINWNGVLKRATSDLWDTEENNPDNAPTLWEDIEYKEGYRLIPENITASAVFSLGEKGWWKDVLYESLFDNNTWTPDQYPTGWKVV